MRGVGVSLVLGNGDRKNGIGTTLLPRCEGLTLALAGVVARVPSREPLVNPWVCLQIVQSQVEPLARTTLHQP